MQKFISKTKKISYALAAALLVQIVFASGAFARDDVRTSNVRFEISGDKVIIHYDLVASADADYVVAVLLKKESDRGFSYSPRNLAGDVGAGKFAGTDRRAVWDMKKEFPQGLEGTDYYF